jgi:NAD(P)-dependent dehydrogenase (short-subunit alcohol dehydrogenase family)
MVFGIARGQMVAAARTAEGVEMDAFHGRVALVTGGASGIGRALGRELARRGAAVVLADVDDAGAEATAAEIVAAGGRARAAHLDVRDRDAFRVVVASVLDSEGSLDLLFNNAGIAIVGETLAMTDDDWDRMIDINVRGVTNGVQAAYPEMAKRRSGHIVNTASLAGLVPQPGLTAYATAKHAVVGLSVSLRAEAARHGVRVSALCPGVVRTPLVQSLKVLEEERYPGRDELVAMLPFKFITPEACAAAALRGVERNRALIVVTPHANLIWRAWRFAPSAVLAASTLMARRVDRLKR